VYRFEPKSPLKIAVLISGSGTTLKNIIDKIESDSLDVDLRLVVSSSASAAGLRFAEQAGASSEVFLNRDFRDVEKFSDAIFESCRAAEVDLVVLGGFLKILQIPDDFLNRVINIHPALIPSFCGRGYYGHHVHEAVLDYGCKVSGCTVHLVDNEYDHGPVVLQRTVPVLDDDTPETLAARVFEQECVAYPEALALIGSGQLVLDGRLVRRVKD
jgi:phosphoribosylglycinamide formyltransferase 1